MDESLFDINKFNIIQDDENYYFFRALNMADNNDIEQGTTLSQDGDIERIRTDRERYDGQTKYSENSQMSLEEIYDHIKMHYRKDTNCISLTSNSNIAIDYGRGSYKDKYIMIKIPKAEFGENVVNAGQYMLKELYSKIENAVANMEPEERQKIDLLFSEIDDSQSKEELQDIIAKTYTAKKEDVTPSKAHVKNGVVYRSPKARISSYQALSEEQLLEVNKVYAKLAILENEHTLEHVIPHSSNSRLRETIGNAFSSTEVIHYGDIKQENIINIPKEIVDIFALIQQIDGMDKDKIERLKREIIIAIQNKTNIPNLPEVKEKVKNDISIEEMYELTGGTVEYGRANQIVKAMFYLSRSRKNAIGLSNILREILGNHSEYEDIIQYIQDNGFSVEPEIISRQSGNGVKLSESVNLDLSKEEQSLVDEIKGLTIEELEEILEDGGLSNIQGIASKIYGDENRKIDKSRYYAEAIISQYNWKEIGIEEFKTSERNELIKRLQSRNCIDIYNKLKEAGIAEEQIPTFLLNIATRQGLYERYLNGGFESLLSERRNILQRNINIEVVERFLGYYDNNETGIRLKDYQQRASDNATEILKHKKFAQIVLPTGAGKTFVALVQMQQYAKEHPGEKMLYLAPQDEILNQIKKNIVKYMHGMPGTAGKSIDQIVAEVFPNITFASYPSLLSKKGQEIVKGQYGMVVLDEIHRTGAEEWGEQVDKLLDNQNDEVKVLGLTATPVRDADGRDMAEETARKLGYTEEEIEQKKYLASNMTLENAIRMGYVVNPKLVYCKYNLISYGKMDELIERINDIKDEGKRAEELQKYNELRAKLNQEIDAEIGEEARKELEELTQRKLEDDARYNLDSAIGEKEILRANVKKGGKYIVFIPVTDQDKNRIGGKTGEEKIKAYQEYLKEVFAGTDINPQCKAMLGSWNGQNKNKEGEDKNQQQLNEFEEENPDETKFMVVMDKANEGLHIEGVDGIIWFRALDENSKILYLQQLGRAIYAIDEDNPLLDDERPTIIDLANNSLTVKMEKEFAKIEPTDDLEALIIIKEWIDAHDGMLPEGSSSNRQEQHYYAVLRRIQSKYLDGFEENDEFEYMTDEEKLTIQQIIDIASEIDLWDIELPPIPKMRGNEEEFDPFTIEGIMRDFVEIESEIEEIEDESTYGEVIRWLETHDGNLMNSSITVDRKKLLREEMTPEQKYEVNLRGRWNDSKERKILEKYAGEPIEKVPEEYREKIAKLREFGLGKKEKALHEQVIEWLETHDGNLMSSTIVVDKEKLARGEMTPEQQRETRLYAKWIKSKEREVLEKYAGEPIKKVPEEYREKIARLREYGLGQKEKTLHEQVIEWLKTHDGKLMRWTITANGKKLNVEEMTEQQHYEVNLRDNFENSEEGQLFKKYEDENIEKVPEEYREKIAELRAAMEKTVFEQVIEFLETHNGRLMRGGITVKSRLLKSEEMTPEQQREVTLYSRWKKSEERKVLEEYAGETIEQVPEKYREKIARLREFGLGLKKSKLSNAKKNRDVAKVKNGEAKELEEVVSKELEKRGKTHEEQ